MKKGKTHYGQCDRANESDNTDWWSASLCGLKEHESEMSDCIKGVSCKKCIAVYNKRLPPPIGGYGRKKIKI